MAQFTTCASRLPKKAWWSPRTPGALLEHLDVAPPVQAGGALGEKMKCGKTKCGRGQEPAALLNSLREMKVS